MAQKLGFIIFLIYFYGRQKNKEVFLGLFRGTKKNKSCSTGFRCAIFQRKNFPSIDCRDTI